MVQRHEHAPPHGGNTASFPTLPTHRGPWALGFPPQNHVVSAVSFKIQFKEGFVLDHGLREYSVSR